MWSGVGPLLKRVAPLCAISVFIMQGGHACGVWYPKDFFVHGGRDYKSMPPAWFPYELYHLNGVAVPPAAEVPAVKTCDLAVDMELEQLGAALRAAGKTGGEITEVLDGYRSLRCAMHDPERRLKEWEKRVDKYEHDHHYGSVWPGVQPEEPPSFDLSTYEALLARLPDEFAFYVRGAAAYRGREYERAKPFFEEIMSLPPPNRSHMELSATYMVGMSALRLKQYDRAVAAFDRVDKLVVDGCADSLGFASATMGWRAKIHYEQGEWAAAVLRYLDVCAAGSWEQQTAAILSLRWTFSKIDPEKHADQLEIILSDERARKALIAWSLVNPSDSWKVREWMLPKLEALSGPLPYADRIAWLLYNAGDTQSAKRWVDMAEPGSAIALWVRAKVLLHDGDVDAAIAALSQVTEKLTKEVARKDPAAPEWKNYVETDVDGIIEAEPLDLLERARAELSVFWLVKKPRNPEEWDHAFEHLSEVDVAHLAYNVMTMDQLKQYVRRYYPPDRETEEDHTNFRDVLGTRTLREGKIEESLEYFSGTARESVEQFLDALKKGANTSFPPRVRAEHLMEAANLALDDIPYETQNSEDKNITPLSIVYLGWQDLHARKIGETATLKTERQYESGFVTASLMWEAAKLLPDNDPLTAEALYEGGFQIKYEDPKAADKFYKALVRRNPNLAIAQEAKKLRWFPSEFNGRVLYAALPHHFITRKRAEVILAVAVVVGIVALAGGVLVLRKRRKNTAPE